MIPPSDYKRLFEAAPSPYLVLSPDFKIVGVNDAYLRATMTRREAILGRHLFEIFPDNPADREASGVRNLTASLKRVAELRRSDTMAIQRYDIRNPNGTFEERYWSVVNAPVFNDDGKIAFLLHHVVDVTAYVLAVLRADAQPKRGRTGAADEYSESEIFNRGQDLQRLNDELRLDKSRVEEAQNTLIRQQRLEAIGKLTGGVAHDFNNLLTAVLGNLNLLERRCAATSEEARLVRSALRAASRGAQLTKQLLAFGRRDTLYPEVVEIGQAIADMRMLLEHSVGDNIELVFNATTTGCACFVDVAHLESAILNLVLNARDAMPMGGTITISSGCIDHKAGDRDEEWMEGSYVYVAVADTGTGMPPEIRERAFEPFFTTKEMGTGLGLSQVYGFAKQSSGHVKIESAAGEGSVITIYLPRSKADRFRAAAAEKTGLPSMPSEKTILIVEDDPDVRHVLMQNIAELGYRVKAAADGREAISLLAGPDHFDVIIADVVMPHGISGVEVAKEAKRLRSEIKILLISGLPEEALVAEGATSSGFRVFAKPYQDWELVKELSRLLATG